MNIYKRKGLKRMLWVLKRFRTILCSWFFLSTHKKQRFRFFRGCWAEVTHGAKTGVSFSEMMDPSISN